MMKLASRLCMDLSFIIIIFWTIWKTDGVQDSMCRSGLSSDKKQCSGGCNFGWATSGTLVCAKDVLTRGLRQCKEPENLKDSRGNGSALHCNRCKPRWDGQYCRREKTTRKIDNNPLSDRRSETCGNIGGEETTIKVMKGKPPIDNSLVHLHFKHGEDHRAFLNACEIDDCEELANSSKELVLKCKKRSSRPLQLKISCSDREQQVQLCEAFIYSCADFWWGVEDGCSKPCQCQDGTTCDEWTGQCPDGKEIPLTTLTPLVSSSPSVPDRHLSSEPASTTYLSSLEPVSTLSSLEPDSALSSLEPDSALSSLEPDSSLSSLEPDSSLSSLEPDSTIQLVSSSHASASKDSSMPTSVPVSDSTLSSAYLVTSASLPEKTSSVSVTGKETSPTPATFSETDTQAMSTHMIDSNMTKTATWPSITVSTVPDDVSTGSEVHSTTSKTVTFSTDADVMTEGKTDGDMTSLATTGVTGDFTTGLRTDSDTTTQAVTSSTGVDKGTTAGGIDSTITSQALTYATDKLSTTESASPATSSSTDGMKTSGTTGDSEDASSTSPSSTMQPTVPESTTESTRLTTTSKDTTTPPDMMTSTQFQTKESSQSSTPLEPEKTTSGTVVGSTGNDDGVDGQDKTSSLADLGQLNTRENNNDGGSDAVIGPIAGVVAVVVLGVIVFGAVLMYRKTRKPEEAEEAFLNGETDHHNNACAVQIELTNHNNSSNAEETEYANTEAFSASFEPIPVTEFRSHIMQLTQTNGYPKEYQALPKGIKFPATAAIEANEGEVKKNRFTDISPYDESRVVLAKEYSSDSDYINASYIDGFAEAKAYIAAQGPLPSTLEDFWHMVWTEGCSKIVMLTNLCEGAKVKCERYWPEMEGSSQTFGRYTIAFTKVTQKAHFTHRLLTILKKPVQGQTKQMTRQIHQFHFTAWPDHGVPCAVALVQFWSQVTLQSSQLAGPVLVHCSAGIGRTGTYIGLDVLSHEAATRGKVSVFATVRRLRKQRVNMVQTLSQYKFLYEVVAEWLAFEDTDIVKEDMLHGSNWKEDDGSKSKHLLPEGVRQKFADQFQRLDELRPQLTAGDMAAALLKENVEKNRSLEILPADCSRACLWVPDDKTNDYINAVIVPSVTRQDGYIITQLPLQNTVNDFWQMVRDWRVTEIVQFQDVVQEEVVLYPAKGQTAQYGIVNIHTCSKASVVPGITCYTLQLMGKWSGDQGEGACQKVSVYCVESKQALSLKSTAAFLSLVEVLMPLVTAPEHSPVIVQCFEGAGLSCLMCSLLMAAEAMDRDGHTSPFLMARLLHTARPQAFRKAEEFEFMVRCLLHRVRGIKDDDGPESVTQGDDQAAGDGDHIYGNM